MGQRPLIDFIKNNKTEEVDETSNEEVDENQQQEQEENNNNQSEALENYKKEFASKLGWTTKEEWQNRGLDPNSWSDYNDYLENTPDYVKRIRKVNKDQRRSIERNAAAAAAAIEEERRNARAEAEREAREAAAAGDADRAAAAVQRAANAGPPPETEAWMRRNTWFSQDPEAQALAVAAVNRAASAGKTIAEQLQEAENSVKKRFPEYFEENEDVDDLPDFITRQPKQRQESVQASEPEPKKEVRMSESTRVANAANSANSSARNRESSRSREKSWNDIPQSDKDLYERHFARKFQSRGMNAEDARNKYAKTYWGNRGEG